MDGKINNRFFRKETKKWYLSNSKIEGEGVFAARKVIRGEIIDVAIYLEKITFFGSKINHSWNPCAELIFNNKTNERFKISKGKN